MRLSNLFSRRPKNGANGSSWTVGRSTVNIGRFTYGEQNLRIKQWNEGSDLHIGSFCSIAEDITILLGGNHRADWVTTWPFGFVATDVFGSDRPEGLPYSKGDITIGHDVWIGHGATILSGVTIGDGAVIGAKSVVSRDVPPYGIAAGHPAMTVKHRFAPDIIEILLDLEWWDLPVETIKNIQTILCSKPSVEELVRLRDQVK